MYVGQKQQFKGGILNKCCIVKSSYFLFLGKSSNVDSFHFHRAVCHVTHSEARWPVRTILVFQFFLKVAWIRSHHLHLQQKFKLWAGKFAEHVKAKHCWDKLLKTKKFVDITQQCFALLPKVNFSANNLNFHWRW